ncbi:potassium transporter TrkH, partial [Pseudomonas aeruginosa]
MLIPMLTLALFQRYDDFDAFLWSSLLTAAAGLALVLPGRPAHVHFRARHMYFLTTASWVVVCAFAALPKVMARHISYTDAFFET